MVIVYHNDLDGHCSGFVVRHFWEEQFGKDVDIHYIEMDYELPFPLDQVDPKEQVFIVDFSLEPPTMVELLEKTEQVVWIDHHGTAIEKYAAYPSLSVSGYRSTREAACVLTYKFCYKLWGKNRCYVPKFIQLVGDRDTWQWKYGDQTRYFCDGLLAEDTAPYSEVWYDVWHSTRPFEKNGIPIGRAMASVARGIIQKYGFETTFHGYKCLAVNTSFFRTSTYFEQVAPNYDIWIVFHYVGGSWAVRMYSNGKVNVGDLAKQYTYNGRQGGGHPGAAGFQCDQIPFPYISS